MPGREELRCDGDIAEAARFECRFADWVETAVDYLLDNFYPQFDAFSDIVFVVVDTLRAGLLAVPPVVVIAVIALLAWRVAGIGVGVLAALGLLLAENMGLWRRRRWRRSASC